MDLSIIIPSRNEEFLSRTIENVLENIEADTEIIAVLDGQWADPGIPDHPRVTLVYHPESIGQRAATNEGVRLSRAKYMMKLDAHCTVDKGFDVKLMADCEPDWTVIPKMINLHAFDWKCNDCDFRWYQGPEPKECQNFDWKCNECGHVWARGHESPLVPRKCKIKGCTNKTDFSETNRRCDNTEDFEKVVIFEPRWKKKTTSWRFNEEMQFDYWRGFAKRPEGKGDITDTLSSIGACWFMHRERWDFLEGLDEKHGSWGQVGTEIACKSWLSGGRQVCNQKTWFSHLFRTQKGFSFPYPQSSGQVQKARRRSKELWLGGKWPKAKHDIGWLIQKFAPVPDWEQFDPSVSSSGIKSSGPSISPKSNVTFGLVYYTDNHGDQNLLQVCRDQTLRCMEIHGHPIVSVSQKPIDFGKNIVMDLERAVLSIFKQILRGCEESDADIIFLLEHDLLYHPSHFDFMPYDKKTFFYDQHRYSVCDETGKSVFYHTDVPSLLCAYRSLLIKHYSKCVKIVERDGWRSKYGYSPPKGLPKEQRIARRTTYMAEFPSLDIRRKDSWSRKRMDKSQFRSERGRKGWKEVDEVPGWGPINGRFDEFLEDVKEGTLWQRK